MSSLTLHAAVPARASRPRRHRGVSRGPSAAHGGRVAAAHDSSSSGPSVWNLGGAPDGVVLRLAKRIEKAWRALPGVKDAPCAPDLKSVDAIAEDGDPTTKVRIENLVFTNDIFRKMHLEVAWGLGGLEVMHVVVYPWASVAAPIYAADLVAFDGRVTLCIADVCPLANDLELPEALIDAARMLREKMTNLDPSIQPRNIPDWGETILSREACVCIGPPKQDFPEQKQAEAFSEYALDLFEAYARFAGEADENGNANSYGDSSSARLAAQIFFCEKQLENDKTRRALERAMGKERTDRYMTRVLFDVTKETKIGPEEE